MSWLRSKRFQTLDAENGIWKGKFACSALIDGFSMLAKCAYLSTTTADNGLQSVPAQTASKATSWKAETASAGTPSAKTLTPTAPAQPATPAMSKATVTALLFQN